VAGVSLLTVALFHTPIARLLGDDRPQPVGFGPHLLHCLLMACTRCKECGFGRMKRFRRFGKRGACFQSSGTVLGQLGLLVVHPGGFALGGGMDYRTVNWEPFSSYLSFSTVMADFCGKARDWAVLRGGGGTVPGISRSIRPPHSFCFKCFVAISRRHFANVC